MRGNPGVPTERDCFAPLAMTRTGHATPPMPSTPNRAIIPVTHMRGHWSWNSARRCFSLTTRWTRVVSPRRWRNAASTRSGRRNIRTSRLSRLTPFPQGGELPRKYAECMDPFVSLTLAAAMTKTIKLGTGVCLVVQRDPIQTAKLVASLDQVSRGGSCSASAAAGTPRKWPTTAPPTSKAAGNWFVNALKR
jgi:hypothetical protein